MLYRIAIEEAPNVAVGDECTVILYFKNPNGTYANDSRLPHGHRQTVTLKELPLVLDFPFPSDEEFVIEEIITNIVLECKGVTEQGEITSKLTVSPNQISIINVSCSEHNAH